jgi:hypothetical protein
MVTFFFSTTTGANGNDNNTIDNSDIKDGATTPTNGILFFRVFQLHTAQNNSGNTISNCNIFNFYNSTSTTLAEQVSIFPQELPIGLLVEIAFIKQLTRNNFRRSCNMEWHFDFKQYIW